MKEYLFTGAGNNFVVFDGREGEAEPLREPSKIIELCRKYRTDGMMILGLDPDADFSMEFFNPDGSGGMMCGNGGRCIVAFADYLGLKPASADGTWLFRAPDGLHTATILQRPAAMGHNDSSAGTWTVRLKMIDVKGVETVHDGFFLNTGTRHFVRFVEDVDAVDIEKDGREMRWDKVFAPEGTNVNFVSIAADGLHVRTFEKGVEGETLACGTGLTASAIAAFAAGIQAADSVSAPCPYARYNLQCRRGDWLSVEFVPDGGGSFHDIYLTGPAELIN